MAGLPEECLDFGDLEPTEVSVRIKKKDYVLREASGDASCKYRNAMLKSTRLGPDGKPVQIDGMADTEPLLVALCLFEKRPQEGGGAKEVPVSVQEVRAWPGWLVKRLFDKAKEISNLDEKEGRAEIQSKIDKLGEKLAKLTGGPPPQGEEEEGEPEKNSPAGSGGGSAPPTSSV